MIDSSAFASRLKEARLAHKLSQEELGRLVGICKTTICNYETGVSVARTSTMQNLARVLDISVGYLMGDSAMDNKMLQKMYGSHVPYIEPDDTDALIGISDFDIFRSVNYPMSLNHLSNNSFATRMTDNCMNKIGMVKGSIVVIDREAAIVDNDVIAVMCDGKLTARRYHENAYGRYVTIESTKTPTSLSRKNIDDIGFKILGRIIDMIVSLRNL